MCPWDVTKIAYKCNNVVSAMIPLLRESKREKASDRASEAARTRALDGWLVG